MLHLKKRTIFVLLSTTILLSGLSMQSAPVMAAEDPIKTYRSPGLSLQTQVNKTDQSSGNITGDLTLDQAIALTLARNQELAALALRVQADRAATTQAGLLPNPELDVAVENFGGSNETSGFNGAETTVALSQSIELGGKRGKRRETAMLTADVAAWVYLEKKADLVADVKIAFGEVLADQQRLYLAGEQLSLSEQVLVAVQARVEAGKVSRIEETRARTALSTSRIALGSAQRAIVASRSKLVAFWGERTPLFKTALGGLDDNTALPDTQELTGLALLKHPRIARGSAEVARQEAALRLASSGRIPNIKVSAGVRRFEETGDDAMVAGISVPLGLFDRNQGAIGQSRHELAAAKATLEATRTEIMARLNQAYQDLMAAKAEAQALSEDALPGAREAFAAAREGYTQGKFGYLELLDARQSLSELTRAHIDALAAYQAAAAEVARWAGLNTQKSDIESMFESKSR